MNSSTKNDIVNSEMILALKSRYASLRQLLFLRSVERSKNVNELFDILDTVPDYPLVWDEYQRRWIIIDLFGV